MNDETPKVSPLEDAIVFIEEQGETYTVEALYEALIDAGYPSDIANEAIRLREEGRSAQVAELSASERTSAGRDQRLQAAGGLVAGAVLAWLACTLILAAIQDEEGLYIGIGPVILAIVMGIVLLLALLFAGTSRSLRSGAQGVLVGFLVIPFVIFFGLAGTCVVIMASLTA